MQTIHDKGQVPKLCFYADSQFDMAFTGLKCNLCHQ